MNDALSFLKKNMVLIIILSLGLAFRYFFYLSIREPIMTSDSPTYIDGAMSLYYHLWLNEYRPPVYPLGLMAAGVLFGWGNLKYSAVILQIVLSLVNIVFVYKLSYEAFRQKYAAYLAAFITATSFRVFSWDFVIMSESFATLAVTLSAYQLVVFLRYGNGRNLKALVMLMIAAILTKPFFLMLPPLAAVIIAIKRLLIDKCNLRLAAKGLSAAIAVVYISIFIYSIINYVQNSYFGITTVGNVNCFGKVLQYKMENLGSNQKLKEDIIFAFQNEGPEHIVNGEFLEPWHFVGKYGWVNNHYREVGSFAKEILFKSPVKYTLESLQLAFRLFVLNSPFKDYIADNALQKGDSANGCFISLRRITEAIDNLYILLFVCLLESLLVVIFRLKKPEGERGFYMGVLMLIVLYHYIISAFFSYGDYCRLLTPCYPLIYTLIALYVFRMWVKARKLIL
ncbi:MAG: glycosyltransferase family 39 protein [Clostridia bacterium]|nr:glycosyltransferase family 39 protein [Clostridia bacterium]